MKKQPRRVVEEGGRSDEVWKVIKITGRKEENDEKQQPDGSVKGRYLGP